MTTTATPGKTQSAALYTEQNLQERIIHALTIYPLLSRSGLQVAIGPFVATAFWGPVLNYLMDTGVIRNSMISCVGPGGRSRMHNRYYLTQNEEALEAAGLLNSLEGSVTDADANAHAD